MITAKPIKSNSSLNDFEIIDAQEFVPGENRTLAFQLFNEELGIRYVPPAAAIVKLTFNNVDSTTLLKTASFIDAGDRSLISVVLATAETTNLVGGNILVTVDVAGDGTNLMMGVILNPLQRIDTSAT